MSLSPLDIQDRRRTALDGNLAPLFCEPNRLPNHTEGGLALSRLPAPQSQAHGEE